MKYLIALGFILLFAETFAEDPICKEKKWLRNPKECCLDPKLITIQIIEKCRALTHRQSHSYNTELPPEEKRIQPEQPDQIESQLSIKPIPFGNVPNAIKRNTRSTRRYNPYDLNEYGDSDEKLSLHRANSKKSSSESSSESREHRDEVGRRHKQHGGNHKCRHGKEHQNYPDFSSMKHNSLDSSSSDSEHHGGNHHGGDHHRHHRGHHHHKHHHRRHNGGHDSGHRHHNDDQEFQQKRLPYYKKYSCFMECVINETGIIENKTINMDKVNTYLTDVLQLNDDYLPIVTDAFEVCGKNVAEMRKKIKELPVMPLMPPFLSQHGYQNHISNMQKCKPWAGYLMMCVKAQIFINCPTENFRNNDIRCSNSREIMKVCPKQSAQILFRM